MKKRTVAILLTFVFAMGVASGGTLAWLTDQTQPITNVFTGSQLDIGLKESTGETYKMVPGCELEKDPKVLVQGGSETCYIFVKINTTGEFEKFLEYEVADSWNKLDEVAGVYYQVVKEKKEDQAFEVLKGNQVTVKGTVTKEQLKLLTENTNPRLTVIAYASQYYKNSSEPFSPAEAWKNGSGT